MCQTPAHSLSIDRRESPCRTGVNSLAQVQKSEESLNAKGRFRFLTSHLEPLRSCWGTKERTCRDIPPDSHLETLVEEVHVDQDIRDVLTGCEQ